MSHETDVTVLRIDYLLQVLVNTDVEGGLIKFPPSEKEVNKRKEEATKIVASFHKVLESNNISPILPDWMIYEELEKKGINIRVLNLQYWHLTQ